MMSPLGFKASGQPYLCLAEAYLLRSPRFTKIIKREYPPLVAIKPILIGPNIRTEFRYICE